MNVPPITIPNFRPKCSKSIPVFRPKRLKSHTLWGGTYLYTLYRGVPPRDLNDLFVLLSYTVLPRVNICGGTAQFSQANYFTTTDKLHNCLENSDLIVKLYLSKLRLSKLKTVCYLDECNRAVFTLLICYFSKYLLRRDMYLISFWGTTVICHD